MNLRGDNTAPYSPKHYRFAYLVFRHCREFLPPDCGDWWKYFPPAKSLRISYPFSRHRKWKMGKVNILHLNCMSEISGSSAVQVHVVRHGGISAASKRRDFVSRIYAGCNVGATNGRPRMRMKVLAFITIHSAMPKLARRYQPTADFSL